MEHVKGYKKLTEEQKELFERTHQAHLKMMGTEKQKQYSVENLKEIKWDQREKCLKVYWKGDTDWFHYRNGAWY